MSKVEVDNSFKLNIGAPSIILLLTVLGLSVFAILSVRAAYSELKMARTSESALSEYYEADAKAEEILFTIKELSAAKEGRTTDDVYRDIRAIGEVNFFEEGHLIYEVPMNEEACIRVVLDSQGGDPAALKVTSRKLVVENDEGYSGDGFDILEFEFAN